MKIRDALERLFWTMVVAAGMSIAGAALLDIDEWKMAVLSAGAAGLQWVLTFARYRLSVLPNPGAGLPGLPTGDKAVAAADTIEPEVPDAG